MATLLHDQVSTCGAAVTLVAKVARAADWLRRLGPLGLSVAVIEPSDARGEVAADEDELRRAGREPVTWILAPRGGDRDGVAMAVHRAAEREESTFLRLDGRLAGADDVLGRFADDLLGGDTRLGTLFIDNVEHLAPQGRNTLNRLAEAALIGGPLIQLVLGTTPDSDVRPAGTVLNVAPLAARRSDVETVARDLLAAAKGAPHLTDGARDALVEYSWPGDVEELRLVLQRLSLVCAGQITAGDVKAMLAPTTALDQPLADLERDHIYRVLEHFGWNRTRSAKSLGIDVKTLYNKLKRYDSRAKHMGNGAV